MKWPSLVEGCDVRPMDASEIHPGVMQPCPGMVARTRMSRLGNIERDQHRYTTLEP